MSIINPLALIRNAGLIAATALILGGCSYDYLQHTDRVSYSAGNAVKANLEGQTINPSSASQYDVAGLGKNGYVIPPDTSGSTAP